MRARFQSSELDSKHRLHAIVGLFFLLLISPGICWSIRQPGLASAIQGLVIPAALLTAFMAIWGRHLWLGLLLLSPFVLLAPAEFAFIATYGHPSDYDILATLVESNPRGSGFSRSVALADGCGVWERVCHRLADSSSCKTLSVKLDRRRSNLCRSYRNLFTSRHLLFLLHRGHRQLMETNHRRRIWFG